MLSLKLGRVDVRFHEPWSLKGFIAEQMARVNLTSPPRDFEDNHGERARLLRTLGFRVLSDINAVSVVMPTALIGTVLLTLRGRGIGIAELLRRIEWLSDRVRAKGGRVAHFAGAPTNVVIDRGLEVLGPSLVGTVEGLPEVTYYAVDRFQLSFYRNMTIHLFISEALVSAAMYTRVKQGGGPDNQRISYQDLFDQVSFLSQVSPLVADIIIANQYSCSVENSFILLQACMRTLRRHFEVLKLTMLSLSSGILKRMSKPQSLVLSKEAVEERTLISTVFLFGPLLSQLGWVQSP